MKGEGMKNIKATPYVTPEVEIIALECSDIISTSGESYEDDDNVLEDW